MNGAPQLPDRPPERLAALRQFDELIRTRRPFTYLRLGDGEVNWMLRQLGHDTDWQTRYRYQPPPNTVNHSYSVTGLEPRHLDRLRRAYERCTWLDWYYDEASVREGAPKLEIRRDSPLLDRATPETAKLFYDWAVESLPSYLRGRRCLFWGAESPLLRELWADPRYREQARPWCPEDAQPVFVDVRDGGRHYSENLDLLADDLRAAIREHRPDTVFLSLASGAKIIGYELSEEFGLCAFDFGSLSRGLAYAATPGYHAYRSFHTPYFFPVDFEVFMDAIEKAYPALAPEELLAKAQAQLVYELQRKAFGRSLPPDVGGRGALDLSAENLARFWRGMAHYRRRYATLRRATPGTRELDREFEHLRRRLGLGWDGRAFRALVAVKQALRRLGGERG